MKNSTRFPRTRIVSRRLVLTGSILPLALAHLATAADVTWNGAIPLDVNPTYGEGLQEWRGATSTNNINQAANLFTQTGIVDRPRMGETNNKPADIDTNPNGVWSNNQAWRYTGQFYDADGIFTFAENIDDQVRLYIDGVEVITNDGWNVIGRSSNGGANNGNTYGQGPDSNGWHNFEVRFQNGGGGAGTVDGSGWGGGNNATYTNKGFGLNIGGTTSTDGSNYVIPIETLGGTPELFRYLISAGAGNDTAHITGNVTTTLSGSAATVTETSLSFQTGAVPVTLTVNSVDAVPRTLISGTTYVGNAGPTPASSSDVTFDVSANQTLKPGVMQDGSATGVTITKIGPGTLIFDSTTASDLDGSTLKLNDGLTSVVATNGVNPLGSLPSIELNHTAAHLRFGGGATFGQNITFNQNSTLEHATANADTLSGTVTVTPGTTAITDVSNGVLRLTGPVTATGAIVQKVGPGTLVLAGNSTNISNLDLNAGRVEAHTPIMLGNNPAYNGGTLALFSTGNTLPSMAVPTNGSLEVIPGAVSGSLSLSGGTLTLTSPIGLDAKFYNGGNAEARDTAFGGPSHPANTYANYTAYFATRDAGGPLGAATVSTHTNTGGAYEFSFNPDGDNDAPYSVFGFGTADNLVTRMSGYVRVLQAGTYTFGTKSDDGSMLYVDGQAVVSNSADQGMTRRTGSITLSAGLHQIDIGMFEGAGGAGLMVDWAGPGTNGTQLMSNSNFRMVGQQTFNNPISVTSNSAIDVAAQSVVVNALTLEPGVTLTKTGNQLSGPVNLNGSGTYGFDVTGDMVVTNVNNGGAATNITKTGSGVLILDNTSTPQFTGGGTISVNAGSLGVILGGSSPTGGASINFAGGGVVLSSKGGDQSYAIPAFTGNGSLEARRLGSGVAGPVTINLTGNLGISGAQTITMGTADNYVMNVGGTATGGGTLRINGGTLNGTSAGAFNGLNLVMAPATSTTTSWATNSAALSSLATQGNGVSTLNVGTGSGTATLTLSTVGTQRFGGHLNAVSGNTLNVVMAGAGKQTLDNPFAQNQLNSVAVQNSAATLELVGGGAGSGTIILNGGTLQVASTGLQGQYYNAAPNNTGAYNAFGTFNSYIDGLGAPAVTALSTTNGQTAFDFNNRANENDPPFAGQGFSGADNIQARWKGRIYIGEAGSYNFTTSSDDGSMLFIDGTTVVNNNFFQGFTPRSGNITLTEGYHDLTLGFYEGTGGAGVTLSWQPPSAVSSTPIPNSVLSTSELYTSANPVSLTSSSSIDPRGGTDTFGVLTQTGGTTLTTLAGKASFSQTNLPAPGSYAYQVNGTLSLGSINDTGNAVNLTKSGPGTLVLNAPASPQLQNAANTINVTGGTLLAVGGTNSPLGQAALTLAEGTALNVSSSGGNMGIGSGSITLNGNGTIAAGRFGVGAAGPATVSLGSALAISSGKTLSVAGSATDNYTLNLSGNISGPGNLAVTGGVVRINTASPAATTVAAGATLQLAGSTYTGGTITPNGGIVYAAAGVNNLGNTAIAGTPITGTGTTGALAAALHVGFNGPTGGFGTDLGLANTLARTPEFAATLKKDLYFGPQFEGDGPMAAFFGTTNASTDKYTAVFSGTYTALSTGSHSFRKSINDDSASFWVDLNQNGVFELAGSAGSERIAHQGGCCGNSANPLDSDGGNAALTFGQTYQVAILVEDTGGGSSLAARFSTPQVAENYVNPSVGAGGIWSSGELSGGAMLGIDSGAELRVGSLINGRAVLFNGTAPKLNLDSSTATTSDVRAIFNSTASNATIQLGANNTLNVADLTVAAATTLIKSGSGVLTATTQDLRAGSTLQVDGGRVNLLGSNPGAASTGAVVINSGVVNLAGAISGAVTVNNGGALIGTGSGGAMTANTGGVVAPGNGGAGLLTATGLTLHDGSILHAELQNVSVHDQLTIAGPVSLSDSTGSTLSLTLLGGFAASPGDVFGLILNDGADSVTGTFAQNSTIIVGLHQFNIIYNLDLDGGGSGGLGNDVGLTYVVPEPNSVAMLMGGVALVAGIRRRRNRI